MSTTSEEQSQQVHRLPIKQIVVAVNLSARSEKISRGGAQRSSAGANCSIQEDMQDLPELRRGFPGRHLR
jgi:hypothetical protein